MFPPFPQESAHHYCQKLISLIEKGDVELEQCGRQSEERKGQGVMIGSLVCWEKGSGTDCEKGRRVVLYAVSGNNKQLKLSGKSDNPFVEKSFFVPSIVSTDKIDQALEENDLIIHKLTEQINKLTLVNKTSDERKSLIQQRTKLTDESLSKVFALYKFKQYNRKTISLNKIIKQHAGHLPPTGTGDCCAPKLLSYAFAHELEPVSMDEVYFGRDTKNKRSGISYEPCDERCGYILPSILGLEILYRDNDLVVVNKPSGLLSVPGKGEEKQDCVEARVRALFPQAPKQCAVHRLDMETSGILICALNTEAHKILNEQFAEGLVHKKYIALLDGVLHGKPEGRTELPFRLDVENRPHQIYDKVNGKLGITEWKKLGVETVTEHKNFPVTERSRSDHSLSSHLRKLTRIEFTPLTGRTHQLRLAASCPVELGGLGIPIAGDSLYGRCRKGERLMLHAAQISFRQPVSGELINIICNPPF